MEENDKALQRFAAVNYIRQLHAQGFSLERCYLLASQKSWGGRYYSARSFERWCAAYKQFQNSKLTPVLPFLNRKFGCRFLSQNQ